MPLPLNKLPKNKEEMIARGMKPLQKGTQRTRDIARRGGLSKSPAKKYAQRLLALKQKGLTDITFKRIIDLMEDTESSELEILLFLEKTKTEEMDIKERAAIMKIMLDWHKMKHGTKEHNSKHAIVTIHLTPQEMDTEVHRLLGRKTQ